MTGFRFLVSVLIVFGFTAIAKDKVKAQMISIQYAGGNKDFHSPKVILTPFAQFIEYKTKGPKPYTRDCTVVNKNPRYWECKSPCSGGTFKVFFPEKTGYDVIRIPAFKIQPSHCEPTDTPNNPWLETKEELVFQLKKLGTK